MAVLCVGFVSCSDDDDEDYSKSIIGTWEMTNTKGWYYAVGNDKEYWDENAEAGEYQITFKSDNTGYSYEDGEFDGNFKWSLNDGKLKIFATNEDGEEKNDEATIKELTSNKLVLFFVEKENGKIIEEDTTTYQKIK